MDREQDAHLHWHEREGGSSWVAHGTDVYEVDIFHQDDVYSWQVWAPHLDASLLDSLTGEELTLRQAMETASAAYAGVLA